MRNPDFIDNREELPGRPAPDGILYDAEVAAKIAKRNERDAAYIEAGGDYGEYAVADSQVYKFAAPVLRKHVHPEQLG